MAAPELYKLFDCKSVVYVKAYHQAVHHRIVLTPRKIF